MLAIELCVGTQFKLEIFCSNVYADDDGTTILEPVERIKDIKACKKNSLNVQNNFISDEHACSHSTHGYLWDAIGITTPNSSNMLSETLAVTFFGSSISAFSLIEKMVLTGRTLVTQTGEFSAVTWANHNLL